MPVLPNQTNTDCLFGCECMYLLVAVPFRTIQYNCSRRDTMVDEVVDDDDDDDDDDDGGGGGGDDESEHTSECCLPLL